MINFTIIAVGKLKEKYWREAAAEYLKRLQPYARITITELQDEQLPVQASPAEVAAIKEREGQKILAATATSDGHYVIALDPAGEHISSEGLAAAFDSLAVRGHSRITFIIGGAAGLAPSVIQRADRRLSDIHAPNDPHLSAGTNLPRFQDITRREVPPLTLERG